MDKRSYAIMDNSRFIKAKKIISCLEYFDQDLRDMKVIEVGCGSGLISYEISKRIMNVIASDITSAMLEKAMNDRYVGELPFQFVICNSTSLPFRSSSFNIAICNQVFEHVTNQQKLVSEIYRVLKSGGLCYIATGNKLWPIEPHTKLPFLSYLPILIADKYVKIVGRAEYDVTLPTYWGLKKILSDRFEKIIDLTPLIVKRPENFYLTNEISKPLGHILKMIPLKVLQLFLPFYRSWIIIGVKSA